MLTHRNLLFIATVSGTLRRLGPGDRVYGVLPISHVYGLASVCLGTLFAGSLPATGAALFAAGIHARSGALRHYGGAGCPGNVRQAAGTYPAPAANRSRRRGCASCMPEARPSTRTQGRRRAAHRTDSAQWLRTHRDRPDRHPDTARIAATGLFGGRGAAGHRAARRRCAGQAMSRRASPANFGYAAPT